MELILFETKNSCHQPHAHRRFAISDACAENT